MTATRSPYINDEVKIFLNSLTVCIGVQKGGTSSLKIHLRRTKDLWLTPAEGHYFDKTLRKSHINHMDSFEIALQTFYSNNLSNVHYAKMLTSYIGNKKKKRIRFYFEKTPLYSLYPHIAYLMAKDFIAYGTKIIVLLRNPIKRFISGYFHTKHIHMNKLKRLNQSHLLGNSIDEYLTNIIEFGLDPHQTFIDGLNELYIEYGNASNDNNKQQLILMKLMKIYKEFVYFYSKKYNYSPSLMKVYFIWLRSCYGPQILHWIYYIDEMNKLKKFKDSFKIIQSEQYFDPHTFHYTMNYILCYIHYRIDDNNYNEWMNNCVENDVYNAANIREVKSNSKTKSFTPTLLQIQRLSKSFLICNKWTKLIIDMKSDHLILTTINWTMWN